MDTSDNSGGRSIREQYVRDPDVQRLLAATSRCCYEFECGNLGTEALAGLVKAASKGDSAVESALLRLWGIRR